MTNLIDDIKRDREAGTAEPWSVGGPDSGGGSEYGVYCDDATGNRVADCFPQFSTVGHDKAKANAERCARVPAMEEALLAAVKALEWIDKNGEGSHPANVIAVAREAIAKMEEGNE